MSDLTHKQAKLTASSPFLCSDVLDSLAFGLSNSGLPISPFRFEDMSHHLIPMIAYLAQNISAFHQNGAYAPTLPHETEQKKIETALSPTCTEKNPPLIDTNNIYLLGIHGSVCSGKTTLAILLRKILQDYFHMSDMEIIQLSTDNFLYPYDKLLEKNLLKKKGHPESYNYKLIEQFFNRLSNPSENAISLPRYSHQTYDFNDEDVLLVQPRKVRILILEGVNVLQPPEHLEALVPGAIGFTPFLHSSISIEADDEALFSWYLNRFKKRAADSRNKPGTYFYQYKKDTPTIIKDKAHTLWSEINKPNLEMHIKPFSEKAELCIKKQADHKISQVSVNKGYII